MRSIPRSQLTGECWYIQFEGKEACLKCEYRDTSECGGENIIITGKNEKGYAVPIGKEITREEI